jgi:superfamily II DNA/RNA helicase
MALGIASPLPVQAATIPDALAGRDVCGEAPTGSGKTLAFGIPLVANTARVSSASPRGLVLVPTRELADQVRGVLADLIGDRSSRVVALYGGTGYGAQCEALRHGVDIVVACPGRLEDLVGRGDVHLGDVTMAVLDEADRMVDMGFVRPVCRLLDRTAAGRQVLLFSATMGPEVTAISRRYQSNPASYRFVGESPEAAGVTHHFWRVGRDERVRVTAELIARHGPTFVFCRTKRSADRVSKQLRSMGVAAAPLHGNLSQPQRTRALSDFASRRTCALVATDVMARGIHVDEVPCVVHFDPPSDSNGYVHRSGRTGRAGQPGTVVSLVLDELKDDVRALQRELGFPAGLTMPFGSGPVTTTDRPAQPAPRGTRQRGTVRFFDARRGYGFLVRPDGTEVFVHQSKLQRQGNRRRSLQKGAQVVFDSAGGRTGDEAHNVTVVEAVEEEVAS